jgi:hypothetical protein
MTRLLTVALRVSASLLVALAISAGAATAASAPTAMCTVSGVTQPCVSPGWYTAPVTLTWSPNGSNFTGSCENHTYTQDVAESALLMNLWNDCMYTYPTSSGTVSGTVTAWIDVEISSPAVVATPSRPPDANGWYNHPVSVSFSGSSFSGIGSCTAPESYGGPATSSTVVTGSCVDNAGKVATGSFSLAYDATSPKVTLHTDSSDESVGVDWHVSSSPAPLESVTLSRTPGTGGRSGSSLVYRGDSDSYQDTRVKSGTRYQYTLTATDAAGDTTVRTVSVTPVARLLTPAEGAAVSGAVKLAWTPVPGASYYNVQLYRGGKILTEWPRRADFRLPTSWRYSGGRHRLSPGRYRWYVWPGFGPLAKAHYGRVIGTGTFVVR